MTDDDGPGHDGRVRSRFRRLLLDITPLRVSRDYRLLWTGTFISALGSQFARVGLYVQVYALTGLAGGRRPAGALGTGRQHRRHARRWIVHRRPRPPIGDRLDPARARARGRRAGRDGARPVTLARRAARGERPHVDAGGDQHARPSGLGPSAGRRRSDAVGRRLVADAVAGHRHRRSRVRRPADRRDRGRGLGLRGGPRQLRGHADRRAGDAAAAARARRRRTHGGTSSRRGRVPLCGPPPAACSRRS